LSNPHRLTKKEKRQLRNGGYETQNNLQLLDIIPLTYNQRKTFNAFNSGKNLFLHGVAGTGKTFISIYLALKELDRGSYDRIVIYRSTVPSRDMGFLPGGVRDKTRVYEAPYQGIFTRLYNRGDSYEYLKQKHRVEFESTAYVRGITIENAIVIVDESQNLNWQEIYSIITRLGNNCRLILCGDYRQTDLFKEQSGIYKLTKVIDRMNDTFESVDFTVDDIVRSPLVKKFIIACHQEGL
jgi:phosphate starvation-inducible PhoH-like protein